MLLQVRSSTLLKVLLKHKFIEAHVQGHSQKIDVCKQAQAALKHPTYAGY